MGNTFNLGLLDTITVNLYLMGIGPNTKKIRQNSGKQIRIPEGM